MRKRDPEASYYHRKSATTRRAYNFSQGAFREFQVCKEQR